MSDFNGLMKKAELFERLSLTGDRKSFLKSLAQNYSGIVDTVALDSAIDGLSGKLMQLLQNGTLKDPVRLKVDQYHQLLNGLKGKGDAQSLTQLSSIIKSLGPMLYSDANAAGILSTLGRLSQEVEKKQQMLAEVNVPADQTNQQAGKMSVPETVVSGTPTFSKELQAKLNRILVPMGLMLPIKEDGLLGAETKKALSLYKNHFSLGNMGLVELSNHIKTYKDIDDQAQESKQYLANQK